MCQERGAKEARNAFAYTLTTDSDSILMGYTLDDARDFRGWVSTDSDGGRNQTSLFRSEFLLHKSHRSHYRKRRVRPTRYQY